jgi:hypothetical protein
VRRGWEDGVYSPTRKRKKNANTIRSATTCRRRDCVAKKVIAINRIVVLGNACCGSDGGSASLHFSKQEEMQRSRLTKTLRVLSPSQVLGPSLFLFTVAVTNGGLSAEVHMEEH